jgi:hypothetical protein
MVMQQSNPLRRLQRIQVEAEPERSDGHVKIRVENYDEFLGWYTSGSLSLPLHQLPLLEQAIGDMRSCARSEEPLEEKVIPFPGLPPQTREQAG